MGELLRWWVAWAGLMVAGKQVGKAGKVGSACLPNIPSSLSRFLVVSCGCEWWAVWLYDMQMKEKERERDQRLSGTVRLFLCLRRLALCVLRGVDM